MTDQAAETHRFEVVRFALDGEEVVCGPGTIVAVKDWAVRRSGVAECAGTMVLVGGAPARERFESTWQLEHFAGVPTVDD